MTPIRILELRSVRGTGGGPEKTILLGSARTDPQRFAITICYLRDSRDDVFSVDNIAGRLPVDYVEVVEKHSFDWSVWPKLRQLVRERRIDIVHAHDYKTDLLAWLLAKCEPVIALSTVHGWTGHSWRERVVYYPLDKRILSSFPKLIAVSGEIRKNLIQHGAPAARVTTVLNGIDPQRFRRDRSRESSIRRQLGLRPDDVVIGSVGRLEPQKRFDLLVAAAAELRATLPSLKVVIVGEGSLRDTLSKQIDALNLGDVCLLLGHRTDIIDLHHAFDMFVQASDYEGTPNAVLEAMALETPVVATDVGGTAELLRDGIDGIIVSPGSEARLAKAIALARSDPESTTARVASARHRIETDLSFGARMAAVEAIYTELIQDRQSASVATPLHART